MPQLDVLQERLDQFIKQRVEDLKRDETRRQEDIERDEGRWNRLTTKLDQILTQATKTNGRVDGHDTDIARISDFITATHEWQKTAESRHQSLDALVSKISGEEQGMKEWRKLTDEKLTKLDLTMEQLGKAEERRKGFYIAVAVVASVLSALGTWIITWVSK